jgi:NADPH-dependent curcumin reductase CurA
MTFLTWPGLARFRGALAVGHCGSVTRVDFVEGTLSGTSALVYNEEDRENETKCTSTIDIYFAVRDEKWDKILSFEATLLRGFSKHCNKRSESLV